MTLPACTSPPPTFPLYLTPISIRQSIHPIRPSTYLHLLPAANQNRPPPPKTGIGIWLMNNIAQPPMVQGRGPRPPDTIQTVSGGGDINLLPALVECLWLTLRENIGDYIGGALVTQHRVRNNFGMRPGDNTWLRIAVNRRLRQLYPVGGAQAWIPRAFLNQIP